MIILIYLAVGMVTVLVGSLRLKRATGIGFVWGFTGLYALQLLVWPAFWAAWTLIFVLNRPARARP